MTNDEHGARMVTLTGLDLLFLEINNLEESLAFYQEQLGLEIESHQPEHEPPMATLRAGRLKITLVEQLETMLRRGRGVHFFLGVTDVDAYYAQLKERAVDVNPPADEGWGGRFITLEDPDKYRLFFVTWKEEKQG
jgi:predicted enzyme related to lactoylglutathione lyase